MGWDISYHPIAVEEIQSVYFDGLENPEHYKALATQFEIDEFYTEELRDCFDAARQLEPDVPFNKGHAFYIAIITGFLRPYQYIRGGAFSFLADDPAFAGYISDWKTLVPERYQQAHFDNQLTENYCGGVFIPHAQLKRLRRDYQADPDIHAKLDDVFSHGRLSIFWKAVNEAIANNMGLLEAAEVVQPNPLDLNSSTSYSNLYNCDPEGAFLYADAAMEQINEATQGLENT